MRRTAFWLLLGLTIGGAARAIAFSLGEGLQVCTSRSCGPTDAWVKHDHEAEIERLRTDLRLRTAELMVTRGQLAACERRTRR